MFTGIVEAWCPIRSLKDIQGVRCLSIEVAQDFSSSIESGDSVAVNGVCLTRVGQEQNSLCFEVVRETLDCSNLGLLREGEKVHVERSLRFGGRVGGHLVAGHVWRSIPCVGLQMSDGNQLAWFALDEDFAPYVLHKGFVALDGVSLTVAKVDRRPPDPKFAVTLIPETRERTGLGVLEPGKFVNLEVDGQVQAIVETVNRVLAEGELPRALSALGE